MTTPNEVVLIVGCPHVGHEDAERFKHRWFLMDEQNHWLGDLSGEPLASVQINISHGNMVLRAPGMLRLDIPMDVIEDDDSVWRDAMVDKLQVRVVDEGDLAAVWFGNVIGRACRLVKVHPDEPTPSF
jgi:hypothetical protein